jgi:carbonic anhydrase
MKTLIRGIQRFRNEVVRSRRRDFERLAQGQYPQALFITCSDSRIDPALLTQTGLGGLFVLRNAGNLIPPHGVSVGEEATIEFAVDGLRIRDIVVCGHSHCGAMGGRPDVRPAGTMSDPQPGLRAEDDIERGAGANQHDPVDASAPFW